MMRDNKNSFPKTVSLHSATKQQQPSKEKELNSLDLFLAGSFESCLKKSIGAEKFRKIEKQLWDTFGMRIADCMSDDSKKAYLMIAMRAALGEIPFMNVMQSIAKKLFSVSKDNYSKGDKPAVILLQLHDRSLCEKIVSSYVNMQKKKILDLLRDKSMMLVHIQDHVEISQGTCYRRAKELIDDGMLMVAPPSDENNKEIPNAYTYTCMFANFEIRILFAEPDDGDDKVQVAVFVKKEFMESSLLYYMHPHVKSTESFRIVLDLRRPKKGAKKG